METFASYLLKSSVWLTGFAVIYLLFLNREKFFILKRIYLVAGIISSLVFPLITIRYAVELPAASIIPDLTAPAADNYIAVAAPAAASKNFDLSYLLVSIYFAGIVILAFREILNFLDLYRSIKNTRISNLGSARLIRVSEYSSSFSFFNYIFVNPSVSENEMEHIMNHELVHVKQKHWFDLVLGELIRMLQWANPFAWIYTRFIRQNHEYLADQIALQRASDPAVYKATLLNQVFSSPVISLSNSFNYSITKTRFDMMKKNIVSPYRKLKVLLILPVFALIFYAFALPEYHYAANPANEPITIYQQPAIEQQVVKGIVTGDNGKPIEGVSVTATGTLGEAQSTRTDVEGKFTMANLREDTYLTFFLRGYKSQSAKAGFRKEMKITMIKDPDYKEPDWSKEQAKPGDPPRPLVVVDGVISNEPQSVQMSKIDVAMINNLNPKDAAAKYGDAGKNGAIEIWSRKKAEELGMKIPFRRKNPEDFPTFQNGNMITFSDWVAAKTEYPQEAISKGIKGRVSANYTVEADGTISKIQVLGNPDPLLSGAVLQAVQSAPNWTPAVNPEGRTPFMSTVNLNFIPPSRVEVDNTYVVVEEMPMYPGGDKALLDFIKANTMYPEEAKSQGVEGRVIIRFIVNSSGNVEDAMVLKGVNPLLDAEALRVVNSFPAFSPGKQGGKPVGVYYMVPVTFKLSEEDSQGQNGLSESAKHEILKHIATNAVYPQESRNTSDEAKILVTVKIGKDGLVQECVAVPFTGDMQVNVPVLQEVVIVGYKSQATNMNNIQGRKPVPDKEHTALRKEAERVCKTLGEGSIAELKEKETSFGLVLNFTLK